MSPRLSTAAQIAGLCLLAAIAAYLMWLWPARMPTNCIQGYGNQCEGGTP